MSRPKEAFAHRWGLVVRFAAASVVAFVAIGVTLSLLISRQVIEDQQQSARDQADFVSNSILRSELLPTDLEGPVRGDRYDQLLRFVRSRILQFPLVLVTVWRRDGTVVFSTQRDLVGKKFPVSPALGRAFASGRTVSALGGSQAVGSVPASGIPDPVLESFVPLHLGKGSKPSVVVQAYSDYSAVQAQISRLFKSILLIMSVGLLVLYLLLLPITLRLSRRIDEQGDRMQMLLSRERSTQYERRRLLDRTLRAAEEERTRLAAELHDGPVQRLARLGYGLERVRTRYRNGDQPGADELLAELQGGVFEEVKDLRGMMSRLRPPVLDTRGLEDALRDRAEAIQEDSGIQCTVQSEMKGRLAPSLETVLYRVSQEALQNVVKHARARHARVVLARNNGSVVLEVHDDGVGFNTLRTRSSGGDHFGMMAMRERVEMIGGSCDVDSMPGQGTRIRVVMPFQGSDV